MTFKIDICNAGTVQRVVQFMHTGDYEVDLKAEESEQESMASEHAKDLNRGLYFYSYSLPL